MHEWAREQCDSHPLLLSNTAAGYRDSAYHKVLPNIYAIQVLLWLALVHSKGILCGRCQDGKGFSAILNHCVSCSNKNLLLVLALSK